MKRKHVLSYRRLIIPLALAVLLFMGWTPGAHAARQASLVGPKSRYLSLGNSLAFGFQPDLNFDDGYTDDFYGNLKSHGTSHLANLACPGETSVTLINGGCPFPYLRKYVYIGPQLNAAVSYLHAHAGQVSPVTLDIGANDLLPDIDKNTCSVNDRFASDLQILDFNLTQVILPRLQSALTVNGQVTGDLVLMNYYDPYQNICPSTVPYVQEINQHLAQDVQGFGRIVDVFEAFGGAATPNPNMCSYTWMCSLFHDIHGKDKGYSVIAQAFEATTGY